MERHRLLALYLRNRTEFLKAPVSLLHVAPEAAVQRVLRRNKRMDYVSVDLRHAIPEWRMDLTDLRFEDDRFDAIICSHVLEHIVDDTQAMRELCRVLKPSGLALIMVPQDMTLEATYEDPTITSPQDRSRAFGQGDHVRVYGLDFQDRLRAAGFAVELEKYIELLPESVVRRHALRRSFVYRCTERQSTTSID
jgi:predicted SAM-dependent methyltransferase